VETDKALSMLGICRRAGKLSCGHDAAQTAIKHGHARLCLLSSDASKRLCEEFERACSSEGRSVPIIKTGYTMQEIGHATSLRSAVLTVDDRGLASRIQTILNIAYGEDNV
jgi:ribosomal protein L7Ae-like RNA K-turn-binding protein